MTKAGFRIASEIPEVFHGHEGGIEFAGLQEAKLRDLAQHGRPRLGRPVQSGGGRLTSAAPGGNGGECR